MSATDELRRLLDERGVEHGDVESAPYPPYNSTRRMTTFWANKCVWQYIEDEREGGDIELEGRYMSMSVTPEQVIAATLGSGTCHLKPWEMERDTGFYDCMECDCGYVADVADWASWHFCPSCGRQNVVVGE